MFKKKWLLDLIVYLVWFLIVGLLFWTVLQLHTAIEIGLSAFFVQNKPVNVRVADVIDKYSLAAMVCAWIVIIVLIEAYLRNGLRSKSVFKRFARIFGLGLLLLFLVDLFNLLMLEMATAGWVRWLVMVVELLIGAIFTYYGFIRLGGNKEPGLIQF